MPTLGTLGQPRFVRSLRTPPRVLTTRPAGLLLAVVLTALVVAAAEPSSAAERGTLPCTLETTERIVAIGDVHGAYEPFVAILRAAGLVDARTRWTGGRSILIQTGDVVDRGPDARRVMDLLRRLEEEAPRAGGRVVALLGNHEVMSLIGDLSYVSEREYATFRSPDAEQLRERFYQLARDDADRRARAARQPFDETAFRRRFLELTPLGSVERQLAFGPRGEYGRWLRGHYPMVVVNGVAFVHGGIGPAVAALGCEGINKAVRAELTQAAEVPASALTRESLVTREDGPLWYRGLALGEELESAGAVQRILEALGVDAIVTGHTVTDTRRVATRFGGRVVQMDTGMLAGNFYPGGRASAVEIANGKVTAIYEDGREALTVPLRPAAAPAK